MTAIAPSKPALREEHAHDHGEKSASDRGASPGGEVDPALARQTNVQRVFNYLQIFFFALTYMSSWETIALNLSVVLSNGGPQTLAWGTLVVIAGALCQAASLAEMTAMLPIAGAQYHWTFLLAPPRHKRFITWMQGWITWFGWISLLAGVANVTAVMLQGLASFNYPDYVAERWHVTLIIFAMLIVQGLMNTFLFWIVPWTELLAGLLHVALFIIFVAVLLAVAPTKNSSEFVFFETSSVSGWTNSYIVWNLGLLSSSWGFTGFDAAVHLSEEVRRSRHAVPRTMFWSIVVNGVLAYIIALVILYTMGSVKDVLNSSFPIIQVVYGATGSQSTTSAMISGLIIISLCVNLGSITSASRLTWAWARDGGLPHIFSQVSPRWHVPIASIWLPVFVVMILATLNVASTAAFGAFLALSSFGLYSSYLIAISCMLHARLRGQKIPFGDWRLDHLGVLVNAFALLYTAYLMVFLPFPSILPVTGENMNYSLPIFGFVFLAALGAWFTWARKHWRGLNQEVIDLVVSKSDSKTKWN